MDNEKKNGLSKCKEILYLFVLLFVLLMIVGVMIMTGVSFYKILSSTEEISVDASLMGVEFTLLLTGLTVFIAGSILMPKVLLEHEVQEAVERYAADEIDKLAEKCLDFRINDVKNDITKCDAHLSRMIALNLSKESPVWSIGWSFRSLKRYQKLDSEKIGIDDYIDFIELIRNKIIKGSIENFRKKMQGEGQGSSLPVVECAWRVIINELGNAGNQNLKDKDNYDSMRTTIRAVKDIVDFEYTVRNQKEANNDEKVSEVLKEIYNSTGYFCRLLCAALMMHPYDEELKEEVEPKKGRSILLREICKISEYGDKGKLAKTRDSKKDFRMCLEKNLKDIEKAQNFFSSDENNIWSTTSFFKNMGGKNK